MPVQSSFNENDGFGGSTSAGSTFSAPADDGYGSPQDSPVSNGYVKFDLYIDKILRTWLVWFLRIFTVAFDRLSYVKFGKGK